MYMNFNYYINILSRYKMLFIVVLIIANSHFLLSQCDKSIFYSEEMDARSFKDWEKDNQNVLQQFYRGRGRSDEIAEADLSRRISVNIKSKLIAKYKEENLEIIENSLNDYLESETESVLLNTKKIIVKHNEDSSPRIHLFKCIKEYEEERENHNNALIKKAKMHFREYNKYFQQKGFTYAFNQLCQAYLYANSVIDIFSLTDSISTALDMFLNEINIEAEPSKIDNVMPGVKTYKETIINSYFSNKNNYKFH